MFYEQLKKACSVNNTTVTTVLKELKLSTSGTGTWKKGSMPNSEIVAKLSTRLNVSADYLIFGKEHLTEIDALINKLDRDDKIELKGFIKGMLKADKYQEKPIPKLKVLTSNTTYYDTAVSAGTGNPLDYTTAHAATVYEPLPHGTSYMLSVSGDSMEPRFHDGDYVFVDKNNNIEYGDIGIFYFDDKVYIKKYSKDGLVSLNPAYDIIKKRDDMRCLGKVIGKLQSEINIQ